MDGNTTALVNELADRADELLKGCCSESEASGVLRETLMELHPDLGARRVEAVVRGVLHILHDEGFFEGARRDSPSVGDEADDEGEG